MLNFLKEKKPDYALDAPEMTLHHRKIVMNKPFLNKLYKQWYRRFLKSTETLPDGKIVEIGSGGGFLKDMNQRVITSDILPLPHCDLVFKGEDMPFEDDTVSAIFMIDVLHHIPDAPAFFAEAQRVLKPGGEIYMIEPANTAFSRLIYKNLHHESFDPKVEKWEFPSSGPLSGANGALPWIIFRRDRLRFEKEFTELRVEKFTYHTPFRYLVSGGLSYKSLAPGWAFGLVSFLENLWMPLFPISAMFNTIIVRKKVTKG